MDAQTLITTLIANWLDKSEESVNNNAYRERVLLHIQERGNEIWLNDFNFTYGEPASAITIDKDTGLADAPDDFDSFGTQGSMWFVDEPQRRFKWRRPQVIQSLRRLAEAQNAAAQFPNYYTELTQGDDGVRVIGVDKVRLSADLDCGAYYKKLPPVITDTDTTSGLEMIPDQFVLTVLKPGVIALLQEDEGDARAPANEAKFEKGLARMIVDQRAGQNEDRAPLPRYGRSRGTRGDWYAFR